MNIRGIKITMNISGVERNEYRWSKRKMGMSGVKKEMAMRGVNKGSECTLGAKENGYTWGKMEMCKREMKIK